MRGIPESEFRERVERIQKELNRRGWGALVVYGDEYRRENLRYVSNFWPIFERAACFIPSQGEAILAGAPEGERYAREMTPWKDIRNVKEFACVSVPEEIEYPLATFSSFKEMFAEIARDGRPVALAGRWDMPGPIFERMREAAGHRPIVEGDEIVQAMRLRKSENEIACLREAGRLADMGYRTLLSAARPGNTERMAIGAAEGAAREGGAEDIVFSVFGSGARTNTIIGRATEKVIEEGDMIMGAMAVQYEGYIATAEFPFVAGKASGEQEQLLDVLFEAANVQLGYLRPRVPAGEMVRAVKAVFEKHGMSEYDVYPPMHGIGLAEAESPYPNERASYALEPGMCVNSDISLFGHPAGSNRLEEGFVIREGGPEALTPYIRQLCAERN